MPKSPLDKLVDIVAGLDRGEGTHLMEPLLIGETSRHRHELTDLALELASQSSGFKHSLPESIVAALADLVRAMNCYYSNLIEGHDTHPVDIERALKGDYSADAKKRDLQIVGTGDRQARRVISALVDLGVLTAESTRADLRLAFPAALASRWMPGLFPEQVHSK